MKVNGLEAKKFNKANTIVWIAHKKALSQLRGVFFLDKLSVITHNSYNCTNIFEQKKYPIVKLKHQLLVHVIENRTKDEKILKKFYILHQPSSS